MVCRVYPQGDVQRSGIAAGDIFYNIQLGTAAQYCSKS